MWWLWLIVLGIIAVIIYSEISTMRFNKEAKEYQQRIKERQEIEAAKPMISRLIVLPQNIEYSTFRKALLELGYLKDYKEEISNRSSYVWNYSKEIEKMTSEGKRIPGGKKEAMKKIEEAKQKIEELRINEKENRAYLEKTILKLGRGVPWKKELYSPQKEDKIVETFSKYDIKVLTDVKAIEAFEKNEEQEQREICNYFVTNSQCQTFIENFIKYNDKAIRTIMHDINKIERFFRGNTIDDTLIEPIEMLAKVLTESTDFNSDFAVPIVHRVITITILNKWIIDFQKANKKFCNEIDKNDKYECIKSFSGVIYGKSEVALFLFLYDIKPDFDMDFATLREMKKEFDSMERKVRTESEAKNEEAKDQQVYENFKGALFTYIDANEGGESFTIDDIDLMDGTEFEHYIAKLFTKMGYITEVTKHSGDQGIDVIAKKGNTSIGIQAKCYSGTVGNSAVQEAASGKALYKVDKVMVITNNEFTPAAKQLAEANNVILWDRNILKDKVVQYGT